MILAALTVFSWLALTKGDWINLVGEAFALPAILVVVVGVVFSLAGDAGFTAGTGQVVPQGARVMMFVGYLVLSVTILHWVEATHAPSSADALGDTGFFFIGLPWAAWVIGRKLLHLGHGRGASPRSAEVREPAARLRADDPRPDQHDPLDHADVVDRDRHVLVVQAPPGPQVEGVLVRGRPHERRRRRARPRCRAPAPTPSRTGRGCRARGRGRRGCGRPRSPARAPGPWRRGRPRAPRAGTPGATPPRPLPSHPHGRSLVLSPCFLV